MTAVFLHWRLMCALPFSSSKNFIKLKKIIKSKIFQGKETKKSTGDAPKVTVEPPYASVDKTPELKPKAPTLVSTVETSTTAPAVDRSVKPATLPFEIEKEKAKKRRDHQVEIEP
jgi:hypothetical protein